MLMRLVIATVSVGVSAWLLPGVHVDGVWTAVVVAIVLGILNTLVKPLITLLTLPITVLTLGLFLLVINVLIVQLASSLVDGFYVGGFWWALLFSFIQSVVNSFLQKDNQDML